MQSVTVAISHLRINGIPCKTKCQGEECGGERAQKICLLCHLENKEINMLQYFSSKEQIHSRRSTQVRENFLHLI